MKKLLSLVLVAVMALTVVGAACADEFPEPEGGKKFGTNWAIFGMDVSIVYEEEGYRVCIEGYDPTELRGQVWEYSCYYNEEKDVLESVSSSKYEYTVNEETGDRIYGDYEYQDLDIDNNSTVFAIDENGMLTWEDGRGNDGVDLEFTDIGEFEGCWRNDEAGVWAEIEWSSDEDEYGYHVYVNNGEDKPEYDAYECIYDPESKKLAAKARTTLWKDDGEGGYDPVELGEAEITLSMTEDGKLVLEGEQPVEMEYFDISMDPENWPPEQNS